MASVPFHLLRLLIVTSAFVSLSAALAEERALPIVIEGAVERRFFPGDGKAVQVPVGVGAKAVDAPVNELGVELKNMERLEELSSSRLADEWWLKPRAQPDGSLGRQTLLHADLSLDQKIKLRQFVPILRRPGLFEGGWQQDRRDLVVQENKLNPYDSSLGERRRVANARENAYGKLIIDGERWTTLVDTDFKAENVHAGSLLTGDKRVTQASLNLRWRAKQAEVLSFAQGRESDFSSRLSPLLSNSSRGGRGGIKAGYTLGRKDEDEIILSAEVSFEELKRVYSDSTEARFQRQDVNTRVTKSVVFPWIDLKLSASGDSAHDLVHSQHEAGQAQSKMQNGKRTTVWESGVEVSSPRRFHGGVVARLRRFALLPTPSQKFGDGALLLAADDLEPETGVRASVGPWWSAGEGELEVSFFSERIENAPVMVAVSPTAARTRAIGGVWVEGVEARLGWMVGAFKLKAHYSFQEALNAAQINWQQGKAVPGRPQHTFNTGAEYFRGSWKTAMQYSYRSEEALDLSGLWSKPPHHDLSLSLGLGKRDWEVRLTGSKLLAERNGLPSVQFAGQTAVDLLQPNIEQTEVRVQCEFLM